jgi:hypothetical protein
MRSRIPYYLIGAAVALFGWQKYRQKIEGAAASGEFPAAAADMPVEQRGIPPSLVTAGRAAAR